ncbi:MAG TPA: redox-regulated ATPase YchF, partial [Candidatus Paceibacterota bacterium]|nr:redox-regulated ATPase YchF [Candidatus Paceibacterota bacterium]
VGIVGLPNVGKSTLFQAITKKSVLIANYPFATIDPSVGVVAVPDERLDKLAAFSSSAKVVPAAIEFVDIAGLVKGASEGEGLGNQFLSHIREVDATAHVVRLFDNPNITHVDAVVDPLRDVEVVNLELILADTETVERRLGSLERDVRAGKKEALAEQTAIVKAKRMLEDGKLASTASYTNEERDALKGLHLLSMKPMLYVLNKEAGGHNLDELNDGRYERLVEYFDSIGATYVSVDANIENELRDLQGDDKASFRQEYGVFDDGVNGLIVGAYKLLGLMSFFTTGADESRAWTVPLSSTAPEAGAAIHTDFYNKFIRAEVINWQTLLSAGSYAKARELGLLKTEGKEYIVKDGDVIEFLHS